MLSVVLSTHSRGDTILREWFLLSLVLKIKQSCNWDKKKSWNFIACWKSDPKSESKNEQQTFHCLRLSSLQRDSCFSTFNWSPECNKVFDLSYMSVFCRFLAPCFVCRSASQKTFWIKAFSGTNIFLEYIMQLSKQYNLRFVMEAHISVL